MYCITSEHNLKKNPQEIKIMLFKKTTVYGSGYTFMGKDSTFWPPFPKWVISERKEFLPLRANSFLSIVDPIWKCYIIQGC